MSEPFESTEKLFRIVGSLKVRNFDSNDQANEAFKAYEGAQKEIQGAKSAITAALELMRNEYPEDCMDRVQVLLESCTEGGATT